MYKLFRPTVGNLKLEDCDRMNSQRAVCTGFTIHETCIFATKCEKAPTNQRENFHRYNCRNLVVPQSPKWGWRYLWYSELSRINKPTIKSILHNYRTNHHSEGNPEITSQYLICAPNFLLCNSTNQSSSQSEVSPHQAPF